MINKKILQALIYIILLSPCLLIRATNTTPKPNLTLGDHAKTAPYTL